MSRHAHPAAKNASIELALIGVAAHAVADIHCR
ncbi:Ms4533A family Cys-rich leader peptide [Streptomyces sp. NPDC052396]